MIKIYTTFIFMLVVHFVFGQVHFECGQEQMHNRLMKESPSYKTKHEQLENFYLQVIQQEENNPQKSPSATYTVPVVFHIMHNPSDAIGQGSNLSLSRLQTELANWNLAFDNTGVYAGGPNHCDAGILSSDVDINFCLATQDPLGFPTDGVERYSFDGGSPLYKNDSSPNSGSLDLDMKELSNWDSKKYLNVWVVDQICTTPGTCGVVGYATFPGASGTIRDGVVVEDAFIGTNTNYSKVMVHELGHYFSLYHTFQGGCSTGSCLTTGDRVCDTPLDNTPNSSNPDPQYVNCNDTNSNTTNTCPNDATVPNSPFTTDVQDMYENYMDYSPLQCTNTFTPNQATRMEMVMMQGGGRSGLNSSTGCNAPTVSNTQVAFSISQLSVSEAAADIEDGCLDYSTFKLKVKISELPTSDVTLNFTTSGTADSGADYDLVTSSVTFNTTGDLYKYFDIRIYDDGALEGSETIVIDYTISGPAVAASDNQSLTLNLKDNEVNPGQVFFEEDFESGTNGWSSSGFGSFPDNPFVIGTNSGLTNNAAYVTTNTASKPFEYDNSQQDSPLYISPQIDGSEMQNATLSFDYQANGSHAGSENDVGRLYYRTPSNSSFIFLGLTVSNQGSSVNTASFTLPSELNGEMFELGFNWSNNGDNLGANPPFAIDNIKVSLPLKDVATSLNATSEEYLGPNETVLFFTENNEILAKIKNTSSHDYGCTTVTIDRSGTGATNGTGDYSPSEFLDKTIIVTPSNNNSSGSYEITMYYSESEISGWEAATGESRSELSLVKSEGSISNAQSSNSEVISFVQNEYGSDWAYTASFNTGFSGFGYTKLALPLDLISFDARLADQKVQLDWLTMNEVLMDNIIVERSKDARNFEVIKHVKPKGLIRNEYSMFDENPLAGKNYYRLKFVDLDGSFSYSNIVSVQIGKEFDILVYPNPITRDMIQVHLNSDSKQDYNLSIYNIEGILLEEKQIKDVKSSHLIEIPFSNQKAGIYYMKVIQGDEVKVVRFFKN